MKRNFCFLLLFPVVFFSCKSKPIVQVSFVDSLLQHYTPSQAEITTEGDLQFWKKRCDSRPDDFVSRQKYAQALAARFRLYGDIKDLRMADSIVQQLNQLFKGKEVGYWLSLASFSLQQHQFNHAKTLVDSAGKLNAEPYATQMMLFDADFETGDYYDAKNILQANYAPKDFAYNFRLSKQDHYSGSLDSAIRHMLKAAQVAEANPSLQQVALSNAADLYIHAGELQKAYELYRQCLQINASDFHSLTGIGWIALVHDKNDSLATKLFQFVQQKTKSPDALFKLAQAAEEKDTALAKTYAIQFVQKASDSIYGNMYNKYLIDFYTSILHQPDKALTVAQKEIQNRATPQTYSWLAWTLIANGQPAEAYTVYEQHVSGKPLEGLELFWMGKMMKLLGKGYNAQQFFKAAQKNKYDLRPVQQKELEGGLK